jgi:hypothetical protein
MLLDQKYPDVYSVKQIQTLLTEVEKKFQKEKADEAILKEFYQKEGGEVMNFEEEPSALNAIMEEEETEQNQSALAANKR